MEVFEIFENKKSIYDYGPINIERLYQIARLLGTIPDHVKAEPLPLIPDVVGQAFYQEYPPQVVDINVLNSSRQ